MISKTAHRNTLSDTLAKQVPGGGVAGTLEALAVNDGRTALVVLLL
jgi:hypothetical protein